MFRSVNNPIPTIPHSRTFHPTHVGTCIGFCHRQRIHSFTAHRRQQIAFALFGIAGHQDVLRTAKEVRKRHGSATQFAFDQCKVEMGQPGTADLFGEVAGVKAKINRLLLDGLCQIGGDLAGAFNLCLVGVYFLFHKAADGGNDHVLFVRKTKVH